MTSTKWPNVTSYLLNEGVSGSGPMMTRYRFESWPVHLWPNVVSMEYMVNCGAFGWGCEESIETVIQYIRAKYTKNHVSPPVFLFLELFRAETIYSWQGKEHLKLDKLQRPNDPHCEVNISLSEVNRNISWFTPHPLQHHFNNRGSENSLFLTEFARFYNYPILSVRDAFYPSFVRFFAKHDVCVPWPMTKDGVHLSRFGSHIFVKHIFKPFLHQVIRDQLQYNSNNIASSLPIQSDIAEIAATDANPTPATCFFPKDRYRAGELIAERRSWGFNIDYNNQLKHSILYNHGFTFTDLRNHRDGGHSYLGATAKDSIVQLDANIPDRFLVQSTKEEQMKMQFEIEISYLHSWDESYIGDAECQIMERSGDAGSNSNNQPHGL
jgi:hypothetical protein